MYIHMSLSLVKCMCIKLFLPMYTGYDCVKSQLIKIVNLLKARKPACEALTLHYKQEGWLEMTGNPTESELVTLALVRMENDSSQYDKFVNMLHAIEGMDVLLNAITRGHSKFPVLLQSLYTSFVSIHFHESRIAIRFLKITCIATLFNV